MVITLINNIIIITWKPKTSQAALTPILIDVEFERLIAATKMQASGAKVYNDLDRVRYRNLSFVNKSEFKSV